MELVPPLGRRRGGGAGRCARHGSVPRGRSRRSRRRDRRRMDTRAAAARSSKDSRHGSYGVAALCGSIVLRIVCVAALGPAVAVRRARRRAHARSRGRRRRDDRSTPTVRPRPASGATRVHQLRTRSAAAGVPPGWRSPSLATGWWATPLALGAAVGAAAGRVARAARAGDVTGDVLGAIEQVGECIVLVIVTGLATHHAWWLAEPLGRPEASQPSADDEGGEAGDAFDQVVVAEGEGEPAVARRDRTLRPGRRRPWPGRARGRRARASVGGDPPIGRPRSPVRSG